MFKRLLTVSAVIAVAAFSPNAPARADGPAASQWSIGPIIGGRNYSVGMPLTMFETRDGPAFDFPFPNKANGHVHYVTTPIGRLDGASRITLRYRIDAAPDTQFFPQERPNKPATLSLYFQRSGDRWTRRTPHHRWYAPGGRDIPLRPGTHEVSIAMDEPWIAMMGGNAHTLPRAYQRALRRTAKVGFTFGSAGARGHGVYASAPARFTVLDYRIE